MRAIFLLVAHFSTRLAEAAMGLELPTFEQLTFKRDDEFRYVGRGELALHDLHDITTGKARYGADILHLVDIRT